VLVVGAWTSSGRAQTPSGDPPTHEKILAKHIGGILTARTVGEVGGVIDLGLSAAGIAVALGARDSEPRTAATLIGGFAAIEVAGVSSIFMPRDDRSRVLHTVTIATPAVLMMGIAVAHDPDPIPRLTAASIAAGYGTGTVLEAIDVFSRSTRYSTLSRDAERLESGAPLSKDELYAMHRHVLGVRGVIPHWVRGLPLLVGGTVALAPAFDGKYSKDARLFSGIAGGLSALTGLLMLVPGHVDVYERDLETWHVEIGAGGGGLQARGWFNAL
jgi:hypothetical protein